MLLPFDRQEEGHMKRFFILLCLFSSLTISSKEVEQPFDETQVKANIRTTQRIWDGLEHIIKLRTDYKTEIPTNILRKQKKFIEYCNETEPYVANLVYAFLSYSYNPRLSQDFFNDFNRDQFKRLVQGDVFAIELNLFLEVTIPTLSIGKRLISYIRPDQDVAKDVMYLLEQKRDDILKKIKKKWTQARAIFIAEYVWKKFPEFSRQMLLDRNQKSEPKALFKLGKLLIKSKKIGEALEYFEAAANSNYNKAIRRLALYHFKIGEHEIVIERLQPLVEDEDKRSQILYARSLMALDRYNEAIDLLKKADQNGDDSGEVDYYFGILQDALGKKGKALGHFQQSAEKGFKKAKAKLKSPAFYKGFSGRADYAD